MSFYAQNYEDKALSRIFSKVVSGTCLEVGAHDGVNLSNTYHFEQRGWRCILVEPNSELCEKIRRNRSALVFECAASDKVGEATLHVGDGTNDVYSSLNSESLPTNGSRYRALSVPTNTIDQILTESAVSSLDFVTIDVEGHEQQTLLGFTLSRWKPRLVLLEDNGNMVDAEVEQYMHRAGYFRFWRSGMNDWYGSRDGMSRVGLLSQILMSGCFSLTGFLKGTLSRTLARKVILAKRRIVGQGGPVGALAPSSER
jgi:FkbM family methyltransferase